MNPSSVTAHIAVVSGALTAKHDLDSILGTITDRAVTATEGLAAVIVVVTERGADGGLIVAAATDSNGVVDPDVVAGVALTSATEGAVVILDNTATPSPRWRAVAGAAAGRGVGAIRAFPIRAEGNSVGSLLVFTADPWVDTAESARDSMGVQVLADLAGAAILLSHNVEDSERWSTAIKKLASSIEVGQLAVGVVAEQRSISVQAASALIHASARRNGISFTNLSRRIVAGDEVDLVL